ncbi:hypothetical protein GM708_15610 [Vibrio cholerae]|nr:hypothetical protein [Vibrio cholerae]
MYMNSRLSPDETFPDLTHLPMEKVEVINSKLHREIAFEYDTEGDPHPETEFRLEEVNDELDARDVLTG